MINLNMTERRYNEYIQSRATCRVLKRQYDRYKSGDIDERIWNVILDHLMGLYTENMQEISERYKED